MSKKKSKRRKLKTRTIWILVLSYMVLGAVVATLFLQQTTAGAEIGAPGQANLNNAWGLFPLIVLVWPIFLVIFLIRAYA